MKFQLFLLSEKQKNGIMKITIIGAGNMGSAIAYGLCNSRLSNELEICCTDILPEKLYKIKETNASIHVSADNLVAVKDADIIILAVKPWLVEGTIEEIKEAMDYSRQILISIAAGVTFWQLNRFLRKKDEYLSALFRVVPNIAVAVNESCTFIADDEATAEQSELVKKLFDELGMTVSIEEQLIPAFTALSSCGIAYAFRYIRAAVEGAVELGINPELAKKIEIQTLQGAAALLTANNSHPEAEIDKVTTPGGITIKGLNAMEEAGFTTAVIKGLKASMLLDE